MFSFLDACLLLAYWFMPSPDWLLSSRWMQSHLLNLAVNQPSINWHIVYGFSKCAFQVQTPDLLILDEPLAGLGKMQSLIS